MFCKIQHGQVQFIHIIPAQKEILSRVVQVEHEPEENGKWQPIPINILLRERKKGRKEEMQSI